MSELATNNLIKIILGVLVFVVVVGGVYLIFRNRIMDFFRGLPTGELFRILIK